MMKLAIVIMRCFVKAYVKGRWIREKKLSLNRSGFKDEISCKSKLRNWRIVYQWCLFSKYQLQQRIQRMNNNKWDPSFINHRKRFPFMEWLHSQLYQIWEKNRLATVKKANVEIIQKYRTLLFPRKTRSKNKHRILSHRFRILSPWRKTQLIKQSKK